LLHSADRPEQVHGGRTRLADYVANGVEITLEIAVGLSLGVVHAERDPHRGSHADRGSPAPHHVADYVCPLLMCLSGYVDFFSWQLRLIDEAYAFVGPFESLNHRNLIVDC